MLKDFKKFISRGNVIDMAVGLIIAVYFGAIVKSLVDDIIMPPIGKLIHGIDFSGLRLVIQKAIPDAYNEAGQIITPGITEVAINYGNFINTIVTFIIVAFSIFLVVKGYSRIREKEEEAPVAPKPSKEEQLLAEIRDLLKK